MGGHRVSTLALIAWVIALLCILASLYWVAKARAPLFTSLPGGNIALLCLAIALVTGLAVYAVFKLAGAMTPDTGAAMAKKAKDDDNRGPTGEHVLHTSRSGAQYWVLRGDVWDQTTAANACDDAHNAHQYIVFQYTTNSTPAMKEPNGKLSKLGRLPGSIDKLTWVERSPGMPGFVRQGRKAFVPVSRGEDGGDAAIDALLLYLGADRAQRRVLWELYSPEKAPGKVTRHFTATEHFTAPEHFGPEPLENNGSCVRVGKDGILSMRSCGDKPQTFVFQGDLLKTDAGECVSVDSAGVTVVACDPESDAQKWSKTGAEYMHLDTEKCLVTTQSVFGGSVADLGECGGPDASWAPVGRALKTRQGKCLGGSERALYNGDCSGGWQMKDGAVVHTDSGKCLFTQRGSERIGLAECGGAYGQKWEATPDELLKSSLTGMCVKFTALDQAFMGACDKETDNLLLYATQEGGDVKDTPVAEAVSLRETSSGQCLTGSPLMSACATGDPAQQWSLKKYQLSNGGKCLALCNGKPVMRSCDKSASNWRFTDVNQLLHADSETCLGKSGEMGVCDATAAIFEASVQGSSS